MSGFRNLDRLHKWVSFYNVLYTDTDTHTDIPGWLEIYMLSKGTIHGLILPILRDFQDSETSRLSDSICIFSVHFCFHFLCYQVMFWKVEIDISDFFVGMNYSISLPDLYLNGSLRVI